MSGLLEQLRGVFFDEAYEGLDTMESALVGLDAGDEEDPDAVHRVFRAAHSIKGGAGSFGFQGITEFTHGLETLLDAVRDGRRPLDADCTDALLQAVDHLRTLVGRAAKNEEVEDDRTLELAETLEALLPQTGAPPKDGPTAKDGPALEGGEAPGEMGAGYRIRFAPHPDMMATGNDPVLILRELASLGPLEVTVDAGSVPPLGSLEPQALRLAWTIELRTEVPREAVLEVFDWVESECELTVEPFGPSLHGSSGVSPEPRPDPSPELAPGPSPDSSPSGNSPVPVPMAEPAPSSPDKSTPPKKNPSAEAVTPRSRTEGASIRVATEKIDNLIDIVGELVITQSMLGQIERDLEVPGLDRLRDGLAELARNTRELQESVMRVRMVPISFVFSRFPRLVRDVRTELGKQVELEVSGESTEVDKTVSEQIADPLVHLLRNALDHGIESPETRRAAGKPEQGHIRLCARHDGGNVLIEITDDGGGVNLDRVLEKARTKGMVASGERPSDEQLYELLFRPGFSTAATVSSLSGRGVGLDVVARNIRGLGGTIELTSALGQGTCFRIRLPLTLSILDGQLVRVRGQIFVVPLLSIVESVLVDPARMRSIVGRGEIYRLREAHIPVLRAAERFGFGPSGAPRLLVVVEAGGAQAGLLVDELLDQQQVVIKSLETNFRPILGLSGATILGDGTVAFIIDVAGLIRLASAPAPAPEELRA